MVANGCSVEALARLAGRRGLQIQKREPGHHVDMTDTQLLQLLRMDQK